jgi:hypothetical protein
MRRAGCGEQLHARVGDGAAPTATGMGMGMGADLAGVAAMPMRSFGFGPEAITEMTAALDAAFEEPQDTGEPDVVRKRIATRIIAAARLGRARPRSLRGSRAPQSGLAAPNRSLPSIRPQNKSSGAAAASGRLTVPTLGLVLRWGDRELGPTHGCEHEGMQRNRAQPNVNTN